MKSRCTFCCRRWLLSFLNFGGCCILLRRGCRGWCLAGGGGGGVLVRLGMFRGFLGVLTLGRFVFVVFFFIGWVFFVVFFAWLRSFVLIGFLCSLFGAIICLGTVFGKGVFFCFLLCLVRLVWLFETRFLRVLSLGRGLGSFLRFVHRYFIIGLLVIRVFGGRLWRISWWWY